MYRIVRKSVLALCALLAFVGVNAAQEPKPDAQSPKSGAPKFGAPKSGAPKTGAPMTIAPDPRVQQRSYDFKETGEKLSYVLFVSSKVKKDVKAPLIVALHGLGGDGNFLVRDRLVDMAEEQGYIVVGPLGYNVGGWYGSPVVVFGNQPIDPPNLTELSEKDVMNVLQMMREEFTVDPDRTYLMGHSMGGAGTLFLGQKHASNWAALAAIAPAAFLMQQNRADILGAIKQADIPLMVVQGDMDTAVPVANTRQWVETMKENGMKHEYIELAGGDHGDIIGNGMADIFRFFAANPKKQGGGTAAIVREYTNVDYAPDGARRHARQRYDLRLPEAGEGPFPLLIYIHGGGFSGGSWQLNSNRNGLISAAQSRGYAVASVGYLLMNQSGWSGGPKAFPELVEDVLAAIRHLRANAAGYRLDPDRFAVSGFSAGGYLTAIVCALSNAKDHGYDVTSLGNPGVSHAVQAAASSAALTDFALLNTHQSQNTSLRHFLDHDATPEGALLGGNLKDSTDSMKKNLTMQNPLTHITANTPPIYMLHGSSDNLVPWQQSEIMVNKINSFVPGKAVLNNVAGRGHADFLSATDPITITILDFLDEKLGIKR